METPIPPTQHESHPQPKLRLDFAGKITDHHRGLIDKVGKLTEADLEGYQDLCHAIRETGTPFKILCGCDGHQKARVTVRKESDDEEPRLVDGSSSRPHYSVVCCGRRDSHPVPCRRNGVSVSCVSVGKTPDGRNSVHLNPSLAYNPRDPNRQAASAEEEFDILPSGEAKPHGLKLQSLLLHAYNGARLNYWPMKAIDPFRSDFVELISELCHTAIDERMKPIGVDNYGAISVVPELNGRAKREVLKHAKAGRRTLLIGRFVSAIESDDNPLVEITLKGSSDLRCVVSRNHWKTLKSRYRDPERYLEKGFHTVMICTAEPDDARDRDTLVRMRNLTWVHVNEVNIPIDSCEEGREMRRLMEKNHPFMKPLINEKASDGTLLPRRDMVAFPGKPSVYEIEVFAMGIDEYLADILRRSKPGSVPLLCVLYSRGVFIERYRAGDGPKTPQGKRMLGIES